MFRSITYTFILICVATVLLGACQTARSSEYVKYENDGAVPRVGVEDAKKEVDAGNAIFVDSRGEVAWEQEHLPGAIVIPFGGPEDENRFKSLPQGKKIIVYCS